jgi:hypothetical protein
MSAHSMQTVGIMGPERRAVSREHPDVTPEEPDGELERRLALLEAEGAEDPAREDLPALDYVVLATLVVLVCVLMFLWGY